MDEKRTAEQDFIEKLGTWHSDNHTPTVSPEVLRENYENFMASRDPHYIAERNRLIPMALEIANKKHGVKYNGKRDSKKYQAGLEEWTEEWNKAYHAAMKKLWEGGAS